MLVSMGFNQHASRRASLRVGVARCDLDGEMEQRMMEAIEWLSSEPEGANDPLPLPAEPSLAEGSPATSRPAASQPATAQAQRERPASRKGVAQPGQAPKINRWAALLQEED